MSISLQDYFKFIPSIWGVGTCIHSMMSLLYSLNLIFLSNHRSVCFCSSNCITLLYVWHHNLLLLEASWLWCTHIAKFCGLFTSRITLGSILELSHMFMKEFWVCTYLAQNCEIAVIYLTSTNMASKCVMWEGGMRGWTWAWSNGPGILPKQ